MRSGEEKSERKSDGKGIDKRGVGEAGKNFNDVEQAIFSFNHRAVPISRYINVAGSR